MDETNYSTPYPTAAPDWLAYFQANVARENALPWGHDVVLQEPLRSALIRTLQRFNLGESGDGIWLKQWAAQTGDRAYCEAIDLFVREEQAHSRWFGYLLDKIGAPHLKKHWSDTLFTRVRRSGGLHFELVTFLTAEIIGKRFFAGIARNCDDPLIGAVFGRIVKDESAHIAFHVATLRAAFARQSPARRLAWKIAWRVLMLATIALVCLDHAALFGPLAMSRRIFAVECFRLLNGVMGKIWTPLPAHYSDTMALRWE